VGRYGGALGQPSAALWGLRSLFSTLSPRCDALGLVGVRLTGEQARRVTPSTSTVLDGTALSGMNSTSTGSAHLDMADAPLGDTFRGTWFQ